MCGFAGILNFNALGACPDATMKAMGEALRFRGPDDETFYQDDNLSFVFRRLSIIDIEGGAQPIWNKDKSIFVAVNGEIYNHLALREILQKDTEFSSDSDSEIVLHLYEEFGTSAFEKLNGMFAITIWDRKNKELVLCRDRIGIKPLYYAETASGFLFGSELKALLRYPDCPRELNWSNLNEPGLQDSMEVSSFVEGVAHFPAGCYCKISAQQDITFERYWSLDKHISNSISNDSKTLEQYVELIQDSVQMRLMSDVPVGIFFSGGLDSTLLTSIASSYSSDIHCFTVVDKATYDSGDVPVAKLMSENHGYNFHPILFDIDTMIKNFDLSSLERIIYMMDSPRFDLEFFYKSELHKAAKKLVPDLKVILLGQGADEFAGGYSKYLGSKFYDWNSYINGEVKPSIDYRYNRESNLPVRFDGYFDYVLNQSIDFKDVYKEKMKALIYQLQFFNLWHEDRTSSYYGIESRVPYLDYRILELMASISSEKHESLFWDKTLIRKAVAQIVKDYPQQHPKVPFFVTDDLLNANIFAKNICSNIYSEFCEKYLDKTSLPVNQSSFDELYETSQSDRVKSSGSAWQLIELMSIVIFERFCKTPDEFVNSCDNSLDSAFSEFPLDAWDKLPDILNNSVLFKGALEWTQESVINIPDDCEIVNLLTESDEATELVWLCEGRQELRVKIPNSHDWLVMLFDAMGRHTNSPLTVQHWSEKTGVSAQVLVNNLDKFVKTGFITKH
ncbi:MAG: asparagine synthase (glutamine-hydrolyzing) [Chromatiales bacterium]|nr:asparagine synthase (glutamine-hydrolyzing) [Chromatiales bacterium]